MTDTDKIEDHLSEYSYQPVRKVRIYPTMYLGEVEQIIRQAPVESEDIIAELRFALRGVGFRAYNFSDERLKKNSLKWLYLLRETIGLYAIVDKENEIKGLDEYEKELIRKGKLQSKRKKGEELDE